MRKLYTTSVLLLLLLLKTGYCATFNSNGVSNDWGVASTWTISGTDSDGIPDTDDDVIINSGHSITSSVTRYSKSILVNGTIQLNGKSTYVYGSFTNNGTISGTGAFLFSAAGTISSISAITNGGDWFFRANGINIAAGTVINKSNYFQLSSGVTVTNLGSVTLSGSLVLNGSSTWTNGTNSFLSFAANITGTGTINASASGNTVTYTGSTSSIKAVTYNNLTLNAPGTSTQTKTLAGNITVNNNLTINNPVQLNADSFQITIGGNYANNSNRNIIDQTIITFNGSGTQTISRPSTEIFNNIIKSGTGTVQLNRSVTINGTFTLNSGTFFVNTFTLTLNSTASSSSGTITSASTGTVIYNQSSDGQNILIGNYGNLTFSNFNKTLPSSGTIGIAGTFNPGTATNHTITGSTISFNGTSAQSFGSSFNFHNLTISNTSGVTFSAGTQNLYNTLTLTAGVLASNGALTLISDETNTARIATIPSGADIAGNITIQRLVPAGATGWRFLGSPVQGNTLADWNDDFIMHGFPGSNYPTSSFISIYTYNETVAGPMSNGYTAPTDISNSINAPTGFWAYMGTAKTTTAAIMVDVTGPVNKGTFNVPVTYTPSGSVADDGWNLIANPMPSQVDFNAMSKTGLDNKLQIWDASCKCYGVWDGDAQTSTQGVTNIIASSQTFYVHATSSPTLVIGENAKTAAAHNFVKKEITQENTLRIKLSTEDPGYSDESIIRFDNNSSNSYDDYDTYKLSSPDPQSCFVSSLSSDNTSLIINTVPEVSDYKIIPVKVKAGFEGNIKLTFKGIDGITGATCVTLKDRSNGKTVDLKSVNEYDFYVTDASTDKYFDLTIASDGSNCGKLTTTASIISSNDIKVVRYSEGLFAEFSLNELTDATISVTNILGQAIQSDQKVKVQNERIKLNLPQNKGIYLINIVTPTKRLSSKVSL